MLYYSTAIWRVWLRYKVGFNPVEFATYQTCDYADAFQHIEQRGYPLNKTCRVFVRQVGTKHKHWGFDEKFYAELLARTDVNPDTYYDDGTADDDASVQLHRRSYRPVVWRGLQRGRSVPTMDSVLDEPGGLG